MRSRVSSDSFVLFGCDIPRVVLWLCDLVAPQMKWVGLPIKYLRDDVRRYDRSYSGILFPECERMCPSVEFGRDCGRVLDLHDISSSNLWRTCGQVCGRVLLYFIRII